MVPRSGRIDAASHAFRSLPDSRESNPLLGPKRQLPEQSRAAYRAAQLEAIQMTRQAQA
jgi:hypothetical protein